MAKLKITCSVRPGNAAIGALVTLVGAVFGEEKELEYS